MNQPDIRPARPADAPEIYQVIMDAFDATEGPTVAWIWESLTDADLVQGSLVAHRDGVIVGHVGLSHAWLDAREALVDVSLLSPLSVRQAHQNTGTGTALLQAALAFAASTDTPAVFLEGDPAYYGARGFTRGSAFGFEPPSRRTPDPAFQVALFDRHEEWMTGRVIYHDVWWANDAAGLRDPMLSEIERQLNHAG